MTEVGSFSKLIAFSSVLGWWIPMAAEVALLLRLQPENVTLWSGLGAESSSTRVKSLLL